MVRKRDKKSLYEVIGKGQFKSLYNKPLEPKEKPVPREERPKEEEKQQEIIKKWPTKPRMVELIDGRFELSVPYTIVIAGGLCLILLFLIFFRLGQLYGPDNETKAPSIAGSKPGGKETAAPEGTGVIYKSTQPALGETAKSTSSEMTGRNQIVIKQYTNRRDLEPVMQYFNEKGIETLIQNRQDVFFLVTKKDTYNTPSKSGTDGYIAIQRIKEIGAGYKAPKGFEQFTFNDPYGELGE